MSQVADANEKYFIKNARELLAKLSQLTFLVLATNRPCCEEHFSNFRMLVPDYLSFGWFETNGLLFYSAEPINVPVGLGDLSYFRHVMQTKHFSAGYC